MSSQKCLAFFFFWSNEMSCLLMNKNNNIKFFVGFGFFFVKWLTTSIVEATNSHVYAIVSQLTDYQSTNLHIIVNITDYNPRAMHRIDVDIAAINEKTVIRAPTTDEEDELCTICFKEIGRRGLVNSLECNHVFHHQKSRDDITTNVNISYNHKSQETIFKWISPFILWF